MAIPKTPGGRRPTKNQTPQSGAKRVTSKTKFQRNMFSDEPEITVDTRTGERYVKLPRTKFTEGYFSEIDVDMDPFDLVSAAKTFLPPHTRRALKKVELDELKKEQERRRKLQDEEYNNEQKRLADKYDKPIEEEDDKNSLEKRKTSSKRPRKGEL